MYCFMNIFKFDNYTVCNIIPNHGDLPVYIIPNNAGIYSSCALDHAMNHGCMKIMQAVLSDLGLRVQGMELYVEESNQEP